jgi:hypothetical protein
MRGAHIVDGLSRRDHRVRKMLAPQRVLARIGTGVRSGRQCRRRRAENHPDRAKVVLGTHRVMRQLLGDG